MNKEKEYRAIPAPLLISCALLLILSIFSISVSSSLCRYVTTISGAITINSHGRTLSFSSTDWAKQNGVHRSVVSVSGADGSAFRIRLCAQDAAQADSVTLTLGGESYTAVSAAIAEGTPLYLETAASSESSFGALYIYRFLSSDGSELSFELSDPSDPSGNASLEAVLELSASLPDGFRIIVETVSDYSMGGDDNA